MTGAGSNLKVIRPLGGDAVSEGFLAQVPGFDAPKVVRLLKPELAADAARAELFIAEARRLMGAQHPNLLAVHGAGRMADGRVYAVSDFVEGPRLSEAPPEAVRAELLPDWGMRLSGALGALHAAGGVHGALAGRHLLLGADGPRLDCTFASMERQGPASPQADVRALARALLDGARAAGVQAFEPGGEAELLAASTPAGLVHALDAARARWKESTAVSSPEVARATDPGAPPPEPDLTGQTLGNYEIVGVVGEGAMGKVYRGRHARIGRTAAVKVLKEEHARSRDLVARFIQEAQAVNAIKNPHIVDVYDFGEELLPTGNARVFCIMELLEGESLADLMDKGPMPIQLATKVCCELAQALGAAHQVGVVHRDIKPENIFLARREKDPHYTKVLDFGVAKLLKPIGDLPRQGTQAGIVIGTPEYMAPEQALGQTTDKFVDIYAVGLVLYEILAGVRPFQGDTFGQLVVEITTKLPPSLPAVTRGGEPIPPALKSIIYKCLEKDAGKRWPTADALAQALQPFAEGKVVSGDAITAVSSPHEELAAVRPSRAPMAVAAVVGALVLGGAAWMLWPDAPPAPPAPVAAPAPPPPPAPTAVVLDLKSFPTGAAVKRLDTGKELGITPLKLELDHQPRPVALEFSHPGHEVAVREVMLEGTTVALQVELRPSVAPPAPAAPTATSPSKKPSKQKKVSLDGTVDPFAK